MFSAQPQFVFVVPVARSMEHIMAESIMSFLGNKRSYAFIGKKRGEEMDDPLSFEMGLLIDLYPLDLNAKLR